VSYSEALYEDESFPHRELAALVAAKVFYQLQEYNESMIFALGAGKLFDLDHAGEFEETILGACSAAQACQLNSGVSNRLS
jgi:26S proteasome regulatory subunit N2